VIVPAKISEIPEILLLTKACAQVMISKGIYQWNEHYPSKQAFERDINRKELYVLKLENKIVGTVVISTFMDDEYTSINWLSPNDNNLYIHRLAVHPSFQKQRYAVLLMEYAEAFAKAHKATSIRLDTFSQNSRNQKFYEQRGYKRLGNIHFPKQSEHPFYCYELLLP
jgi:ribosomal protein S18 acetylase RimI-like enzyme